MKFGSAAATTVVLTTALFSGPCVGANQWNPKSICGRGAHSTLKAGTSCREKPGTHGTRALSPRGGDDASEGKATMAASVFNLINNVAGAGILTLSAAMASGSGLIPAMLICAGLGLLSGHSFSIIGDACELTGEADFKVSVVQFLV